MSIGTRIKQEREQQGIGAAELARRVGITRSYLHSIEGDAKVRPGAELLWNMAEVLGVSFEYLLGKRDKNGARIPPGIPPAVTELAQSDSLPESDVWMLSQLSTDGKPRGVTEWRFIYQAIQLVCVGHIGGA